MANEDLKQPKYYITVWVWNGSEGYDPFIEFEADNEREVREHFDNMSPDIDNPLVELYMCGEETDERLDYKEVV